MAHVSLNNILKSYGDVQVVHGIDLEIEDGEFVVFVGPSGCGKSSLLRLVAGLEEITGGEISIGGRVVNEVAPSKRGVAMVFQTYALYPHMTVYRNMAFGLKQARLPETEIRTRVEAAAKALGLTDYLDRKPRALSGGQRQRVAIGRAIVREPEVFLFDEPLSNLDAALRVQTRLEIARLHQRLGSTMIYVTHDQVEAMTLADKIVVLRQGRIEQVGAPVDLYERPINTFVAQFIGSPKMNFLAPDELAPGAPAALRALKTGEILVGIRPEHLRACDAGQALVTARLELVEQLGEYALLHLKTKSGVDLVAKMENGTHLVSGDHLGFTARPEQIHYFDESTGKRTRLQA